MLSQSAVKQANILNNYHLTKTLKAYFSIIGPPLQLYILV